MLVHRGYCLSIASFLGTIHGETVTASQNARTAADMLPNTPAAKDEPIWGIILATRMARNDCVYRIPRCLTIDGASSINISFVRAIETGFVFAADWSAAMYASLYPTVDSQQPTKMSAVGCRGCRVAYDGDGDGDGGGGADADDDNGEYTTAAIRLGGSEPSAAVALADNSRSQGDALKRPQQML
ncbi:hypothetical protein F4861DRAFT_540070 [Xylaria intraflava]|nr:hypothetical protein F4861DRAFT_540070 [Xylaria intraflava]